MTKPKPAAALAQDGQVSVGTETLLLRFGWGAFTSLADALGCTVDTVEETISGMPVSALNQVVWAGALDNHPTITVEQIAAGLNAMDFREAKLAVTKASKLMQAAFADSKDMEAASEGAARPPAGQ